MCPSAPGIFKFLASYSKNLKSAHRWKGNSFISRDSAGDSAGDAPRKQQARQTRDQGHWLLFTAPFHGISNEDVLISRACSFWIIVLGLGLCKFFFIACGFFSMIHLNLIKLIQNHRHKKTGFSLKVHFIAHEPQICSSYFCPLPLVPTYISGHVCTDRFGVSVAPGRREFQDAKRIVRKEVCV